jgi:hypothetical protein
MDDYADPTSQIFLIELLVEGSADIDLYWRAKADLALKSGDPAAARAAVDEARRVDPANEIPATLNP